MPEEIFDVCDAQDRVIGQATRYEVHAKNLLHRAVHIWLWNSRGELMIHLRSETKDQYPSCYTSSASGHVDHGETYEEAAHRELREELGLKADLTHCVVLPASPETAYEHTALFTFTSDEAPIPDPNEIASIHYLPQTSIRELILRQPEKFTPPFRELFHWYDQSLKN